jgi:hypothetical protein
MYSLLDQYQIVHFKKKEMYRGGKPVLNNGKIQTEIVPIYQFRGCITRPKKEQYIENETQRYEEDVYNIRTDTNLAMNQIRSGDCIAQLLDTRHLPYIPLEDIEFTTNSNMVNETTFLVKLFDVNYVKIQPVPFKRNSWYTRINIKSSTTSLYGRTG